jgi:hypothetical protein
VEIATGFDLRRYCYVFISIYQKVLRPGVKFDAWAIVSREQGALVFFEFRTGATGKIKFETTDRPIGKALEKLPQRAFRGNLSSVKFLGKNVVAERNKLIIVKGDNSKEAWSAGEARKDAIEEVGNVAGMGGG